MKKNNVYKFKNTEMVDAEFTEEIVSVNFAEIDQIRFEIRRQIPKLNKHAVQRHGRLHSYDQSRWHIGRGVTRVKFDNVNVSAFAMKKLIEHLVNIFPYSFLAHGTDLWVYMRGNPKER